MIFFFLPFNEVVDKFLHLVHVLELDLGLKGPFSININTCQTSVESIALQLMLRLIERPTFSINLLVRLTCNMGSHPHVFFLCKIIANSLLVGSEFWFASGPWSSSSTSTTSDSTSTTSSSLWSSGRSSPRYWLTKVSVCQFYHKLILWLRPWNLDSLQTLCKVI